MSNLEFVNSIRSCPGHEARSSLRSLPAAAKEASPAQLNRRNSTRDAQNRNVQAPKNQNDPFWVNLVSILASFWGNLDYRAHSKGTLRLETMLHCLEGPDEDPTRPSRDLKWMKKCSIWVQFEHKPSFFTPIIVTILHQNYFICWRIAGGRSKLTNST